MLPYQEWLPAAKPFRQPSRHELGETSPLTTIPMLVAHFTSFPPYRVILSVIQDQHANDLINSSEAI